MSTPTCTGGVPEAEIAERAEAFARIGFSVDGTLIPRPAGVDGDHGPYRDFAEGLAREDLAGQVAGDPGVHAKREELFKALDDWWERHPLCQAQVGHPGITFTN